MYSKYILIYLLIIFKIHIDDLLLAPRVQNYPCFICQSTFSNIEFGHAISVVISVILF